MALAPVRKAWLLVALASNLPGGMGETGAAMLLIATRDAI